ncbi:MAG: EamA family transporter [Bacteroidales bacterium]|jgi:drug/metabolite transporter (DMT)-like permease|nr:EamA family transporter [Bacteroidales bacterium]
MNTKSKIWHWLAVALLSMIWGTSYILMKKGLRSFSPYQLASLRIIISCLCLLPLALRSLSKFNNKNFISILVIGFFGSGIPAILYPLAETRIDSSLTGMLNTLSSAFTLLIGIIFYKRKAIRSQIAGVILGFVGAAGLLYGGSLAFNYYGLFVVLATLMNGISNNEVSKVEGLKGFEITALSFLVVSPFALALLLGTDLHAVVLTPHWLLNLGYIAILSVLGSAFANVVYYFLIRDTSPMVASVVAYFIPVVATFWGLSDDEHLASTMVFSVLLILAGVYLINRPGALRKIRQMIK